jgi:hypothetical protein
MNYTAKLAHNSLFCRFHICIVCEYAIYSLSMSKHYIVETFTKNVYLSQQMNKIGLNRII